MKRSRVVVPWRDGLHFRPAARLVRLAQQHRSSIFLKWGRKVADLRSILGVIARCAAMGTPIEVEAIGEDEQDAIQAVRRVFSAWDSPDLPGCTAVPPPPPIAMPPRFRHRPHVNY